MSDVCKVCGSSYAPVHVLVELASFGGAGYTNVAGKLCRDCADRVVKGELKIEVLCETYDTETGTWH